MPDLLDNALDTLLLIANAEVPHLLADPADLLALADATDLVDRSSMPWTLRLLAWILRSIADAVGRGPA